jgi:hypothetical protein
VTDGGSASGEFLQLGARDDRKFRPRQRLDVVVCYIEKEVLEIQRLTGDVERDDLPASITSELLAIGEA